MEAMLVIESLKILLLKAYLANSGWTTPDVFGL